MDDRNREIERKCNEEWRQREKIKETVRMEIGREKKKQEEGKGGRGRGR